MTSTHSITVTVLPASTNAGKETIRTLLASSPNTKINALYRNPSKAPAEFLSHPNFSAHKGDVADVSTLDFSSSDVVFYIPPPTYDGTDTAEWGVLSAGNVKTALQNAGGSVKRLVLFSAIGAQHDHSIGILKLNHIADEVLENAVDDVVVIRPGYFMEGFAPWLEEANATGVAHAWITPLDYRAPIVGLRDISNTVAAEIVKPFAQEKSPRYIKIFGPRHYSSQDLQAAMGEVLGKEIRLEAVLPDQLAGYFGQVFPPQYVQEFVDMTTAVLPGGIMVEAGDFGYEDEVEKNTTVVRGTVELVDGIRGLWEGMLAAEKEKEKE
ncbi:hypothetical protein V8F20_006962 [Naviculisporaceae sp. PSN 640]